MKKRMLYLAALCFALLAPGAVMAAPAPDVAPVLEKFQATYAAMASFRATFSQELRHQESGTVEHRKGTLLFQKPLLVRWETAAPDEELLLVTKAEIWNYLPDEKLAYRYSLQVAQDSRSLIMVVTGQSRVDRDFDVERVPSDTADAALIHLILYPKDPTPQLTEAQIWLDPATSLIRRAEVMDFYGNVNAVQFDSLIPNAPLTDADFSFQPPADVDVEDHTDSTTVIPSPLLN